MATSVAIAIRRSEAMTRLTKAAQVLAAAAGMTAPDLALSHRDPVIAQAMQLEVMAEFLEQLALAKVPTKAPAKRSK